MGKFLLGLAVGAVAAFAVLQVTSDDAGTRSARRDAPSTRIETVERDTPPSTTPSEAEAEAERATRPFAEGEAILRIGDGYVFGANAATPGDSPDGVDIYCQDIRHTASFACPHGAIPASAPLSSVGLPSVPAKAAALLHDAPMDLPDRNLSLGTRVTPDRVEVGCVAAGDGKTYKVYVLGVRGNPAALERTVRIGFAEIPRQAKGGRLDLPEIDGERPLPPAAAERMLHVMKLGRVMGSGYSGYLRGNYVTLKEVPSELVLDGRKNHVALHEALTGRVVFERDGALYAGRGVTSSGHVTFDNRAALSVEGDMGGTVLLNRRGFVHMTGHLTGTVEMKAYSALVVDGELHGTIKVRTYTTILIRGRILGKFDMKGSCWSTWYFETPISRTELEQMEGDFHQVTLHVKQSDLALGKHKKIGRWREVIVGDKIWEKLGR